MLGGVKCLLPSQNESDSAAAWKTRWRYLPGDTHPADKVHPEVVEAMQELDIDLSHRVPQKVSTAALNECDAVLTMGCSTLELDAEVEVRDWGLDDPHGQDIDRVREIGSEIEGRVTDLFDEFFGDE